MTLGVDADGFVWHSNLRTSDAPTWAGDLHRRHWWWRLRERLRRGRRGVVTMTLVRRGNVTAWVYGCRCCPWMRWERRT